MSSSEQNASQKIEELTDRIEELEIQLRHQSNDLRLTKEEYEHSVERYFEIYSNMEKIIDERTSKLRESREILEQKGNELQIILDSAPVMIYFKDTNGEFLRVNRRFAEVVGLSIEEIIGKTYSDLFPEHTDYSVAGDQHVIETGASLHKEVETIYTLNGKRQIRVDRIPYRKGENEVIGVIGFANDITEMKRIEAEKKKLEEELAQAQKMESIGVLAGGVAHDFNNILGVILGYTQLVYHKMEDGSPLKSHLNEVIKSTQQATGIVQTLLDYARPQEFEFKPANLSDHISFVLKQLRKQSDFDSSRLTLELDGDKRATAKVDVGKLEQALFNLGKNAIQAIPEGRNGRVVFAVERVNLDERECRTKLGLEPGPHIAIHVSDNGRGIPSEHISRVFEPFFTTKQIGEGTGLGLSQVYSAIKGHDGYVDVESKVEEGTTFTIYLRATEESVKNERERKLNGNYHARNGEKIAIVEDTDRMRNLIHTVLREYGYQTQSVCENLEDLVECNKQRPDLVIMDVRMQQLNGKERLMNILREYPDVRVILSSGQAVNDEKIQALGADAFLAKPYKPELLVKTVRDVLDKTPGLLNTPDSVEEPAVIEE